MDRKIRFTDTAVFKREGKPDVVYEAGKEYTLREDRARRWINRGKAVEATAAEPAAATAPAKAGSGAQYATGDVPAFAYDSAAADVAAGRRTLDEATAYIVDTFKGEPDVVRAEIEARVEKLQPPKPAPRQPEAAKAKPDVDAPVNFQASRDSAAFLRGDDKSDGDTVASPADVSGKDSSGAGVGSGADTGRGRGGKGGGRSGAGHK